MGFKMLELAPFEAEKEGEVVLRQAFEILKHKLKPPFFITSLTKDEYLQLNQALLYGVLCQPKLAMVHMKHLHGIVSDGYACFAGLMVKVVNEMYVKLVGDVKIQLIWLTKQMIYVCAVGVDKLIVSLLRQIVGGDFSEVNLWLCYEMVNMLTEKWEWLTEEEPLVVPCVLYVFLRVLSDHCRRLTDPILAPLKRLEIGLCVRLLREKFHFCLKVGRDLVRVLQDLAIVPEFRAVLKDLMLNPATFGIPGFSDIMQLYRTRTSSKYLLLRVTPEMEEQLRFLLTYVKFGKQRRYQEWFSKKFLFGPDKEVIISDIVRFICCAHHPSNEIIQSEVIPRWAVLGWLLKYSQKNYIVANVKLALFYDWLFFDEGLDNIMNIEPALLLMVHSVPQYMDVTFTLLEFVIFLVENYDIERKNEITSGVVSAFNTLLKKGVVHSLDVLTSCKLLHPGLRGRLELLLKASYPSKLLRVQSPIPLVSQLDTTSSCPMETEKLLATGDGGGPVCRGGNVSVHEPEKDLCLASDQVSPCNSVEKVKIPTDALQTVYQILHDNIDKSYTLVLQSLDKLLSLIAEFDDQSLPKNSSEAIFSKIVHDFELNGHNLFASPSLMIKKDGEADSISRAATVLAVRKLSIFPKNGMLEVFSLLLREDYPVRAAILFYVTRLAYEVQLARSENLLGDMCPSDSRIELLKFHIEEFTKQKKVDTLHAVSSIAVSNKNLLEDCLSGAFNAYQFLLSFSNAQNNGEDRTLSELLAYDLQLCFEWDTNKLIFMLGSIFSFLPDLSVGKDVIIRLLVISLSDSDFLDLEFQMGMKKIVVFGSNTDMILHIVEDSLDWDSSLQRKLWVLLKSELAVSEARVDRLVLDFFGSENLDQNNSFIAAEGLMTVCCCGGPRPELVGAIMLFPTDSFPGFSESALSTWASQSRMLLLSCLVEFIEKLHNAIGDSTLSEVGIRMNEAAVQWVLNFYNAQGADTNILRKFYSQLGSS